MVFHSVVCLFVFVSLVNRKNSSSKQLLWSHSVLAFFKSTVLTGTIENWLFPPTSVAASLSPVHSQIDLKAQRIAGRWCAFSQFVGCPLHDDSLSIKVREKKKKKALLLTGGEVESSGVPSLSIGEAT